MEIPSIGLGRKGIPTKGDRSEIMKRDRCAVAAMNAMPATSSSQKRKWLLSATQRMSTSVEHVIVQKKVFEDIAYKIVCIVCKEDKLCKPTPHQTDTSVVIKCNKYNSFEVNSTLHNQVECREKIIYQVTLMLIYAAVMYFFAYSVVEKFCGLLNIRHFARKMHTCYATFIRGQEEEIC